MFNDIAILFDNLSKKLYNPPVHRRAEKDVNIEEENSLSFNVILSSYTPSDWQKNKLKKIKREERIKIGIDFSENNLLAFKGFDPIKFPNPWDWTADPFNSRTWRWLLLQWDFVPSLIAYDQENASNTGAIKCVELLKSWQSFFPPITEFYDEIWKYPEAWGDHVTAIRPQNLMLLIAHLKRMDMLVDPELIVMLRDHLTVLRHEKFYNKNTNHGFDQALSLFEISHEFPELDPSEDIRQLATRRLQNEIMHAFASDGMHKENSSGYLIYGLKQALTAFEIIRLYSKTTETSDFLSETLRKSIKSLTHMTRPDGHLPLIGDTELWKVTDFFGDYVPDTHSIPYYEKFLWSIRQGRLGVQPSDVDLVLPASGWAIFRSSWDDFENATHIVFKSGFLSTYHRQDDDLSFVLFAMGEEWIIDGGLYKHDAKDPMRVYMRSHHSHSLSSPYGARAHRDPSRAGDGSIGIYGYTSNKIISEISGKTTMFEGYDATRKLTYNRSKNKIDISDSIVPTEKEKRQRMKERSEKGFTTYLTRFLVPADKKIKRTGNGFEITGKKGVMLITEKKDNSNVKIIKGQSDPVLGWRSTKAGNVEPAYSLEFIHVTERLDAHFEITMRPL